MASSVRQMLQDAPYDSSSLVALLRGGGLPTRGNSVCDGESDAPILSDEARQKVAWIEAMDQQ